MQIWDSTWSWDAEETVKDWYDEFRAAVAPDARLYIIDLSSYGDLVTPEGYEDVYTSRAGPNEYLTSLSTRNTPTRSLTRFGRTVANRLLGRSKVGTVAAASSSAGSRAEQRNLV